MKHKFYNEVFRHDPVLKGRYLSDEKIEKTLRSATSEEMEAIKRLASKYPKLEHPLRYYFGHLGKEMRALDNVSIERFEEALNILKELAEIPYFKERSQGTDILHYLYITNFKSPWMSAEGRRNYSTLNVDIGLYDYFRLGSFGHHALEFGDKDYDTILDKVFEQFYEIGLSRERTCRYFPGIALISFSEIAADLSAFLREKSIIEGEIRAAQKEKIALKTEKR